MTIDQIPSADRHALSDEIAAAGEYTGDWETATLDDLRMRAASCIAIRDQINAAWCYACSEVVAPEDDRTGCGCHCPNCNATL